MRGPPQQNVCVFDHKPAPQSWDGGEHADVSRIYPKPSQQKYKGIERRHCGDVFEQINHGEYPPNKFEITHIELVDEVETGGLCGFMGDIGNSTWSAFAKRTWKRLFCRYEGSSIHPLASPSIASMLDSIHDNSTTRWGNTAKDPSGYSTASSSDSDEEYLREENRRWRRGFY